MFLSHICDKEGIPLSCSRQHTANKPVHHQTRQACLPAYQHACLHACLLDTPAYLNLLMCVQAAAAAVRQAGSRLAGRSKLSAQQAQSTSATKKGSREHINQHIPSTDGSPTVAYGNHQ